MALRSGHVTETSLYFRAGQRAMPRNTPPTSFIIKFVSPDLRPWKMPMAVLARAFTAVQGLVCDELEEDSDRPQLHLLSVKIGSASYPVSSEDSERAVESLTSVGRAINDPILAERAPYMLSHVKELSKIAKSIGCEVELALPEGAVLARITPDTYGSIVKVVFIRGESSVEGEIIRVGGATGLHCALRVRGQRLLVYCEVDGTQVARELGEHLYEYAILTGTATWYRKSWQLHHLIIKAMHQIDKRSIVDRFEEVRRAGGYSWDDIDDADEFVKEIRGEE